MTLPDLSSHPMSATLSRVRLITRVAGAVQAASTPHSTGPEHRELYLSPRGFRTGLLAGGVELWIDLLQRNIRIVSVDGSVSTVDITESDAETITTSVARGMAQRSGEIALDAPVMDSNPEPLRTAPTVDLLTGWAGVHDLFARVRSQLAAPATAVTVDPNTLDVGIRLYSGVVPSGASGPGETIRLWLSPGVYTEEEPAFLAELTPTTSRPRFELRPSGAKWDEDGSRARLVYRAIAPRSDWQTALGWFCDSAIAALSQAARWDVRALSPAVLGED
ncbi:MAG: DUF5996 family protein [Alkalispirochaeta sp.]